ncbi:MAG TPA: ATP phosphoribosyltransferase regulatory subunit, partial [Ardenticatenaceae bacterium]|jgi:histidyl-tRNA synthetase
VELDETLKGKYGSEAERLIYSVTYGPGEERMSLRYDLSVPLCRVIAMNPNLPKPFKRYHIAPVWRADRPQKGRYREFYQCDADTVGSTSMLGDAETVAVIYTILSRLGFRAFTTYINNRKLLNGIGQFAGVPDTLLRGLYQSIDKLAKIGTVGVREELLTVGLPNSIQESLRRVSRLYLQKKLQLSEVGARLRQETIPDAATGATVPFPEEVAAAVEPVLRAILSEAPDDVDSDVVQETAGQLISGVTPILREIYGADNALIPEEVVDRMLSLLEVRGDNRTVLAALRERLSDYPEALEGISELEEMIHYLDLLGVPERYYSVDVSMARGLEYYTGPIFETIVEEANIGSITGGGRFDNLVGMFTDRSLPAVGTTIGIERIIVVMEEQNMFPASLGKTTAQVLVTTFGKELVDASIKAAVMLRREGLQTQIYFDADSLREQIGYAATKEIPVLVIIGPDEAANNQLTIRNLRTKKQQTVGRDEATSLIREWLQGDAA